MCMFPNRKESPKFENKEMLKPANQCHRSVGFLQWSWGSPERVNQTQPDWPSWSGGAFRGRDWLFLDEASAVQ